MWSAEEELHVGAHGALDHPLEGLLLLLSHLPQSLLLIWDLTGKDPRNGQHSLGARPRSVASIYMILSH